MMFCCTSVVSSMPSSAAVRFSHGASSSQLPNSSQQHPRHVASTSVTRYPHVVGAQATVASRAQLMPFIFGVSSDRSSRSVIMS